MAFDDLFGDVETDTQSCYGGIGIDAVIAMENILQMLPGYADAEILYADNDPLPFFFHR